jgi:hypothetical protein
VALAIVLLSGGSADKPGAVDTPAAPVKTEARTPSPPAPAPAQAPKASPASTLTSFYTRAANDDFAGAWAMGTDNLHAQFGSLATFQSTLATLESISFPALRATGLSGSTATVEFSSVAKHPDRTDHCTGRATLVRQRPGWLVDHLDVQC